MIWFLLLIFDVLSKKRQKANLWALIYDGADKSWSPPVRWQTMKNFLFGYAILQMVLTVPFYAMRYIDGKQLNPSENIQQRRQSITSLSIENAYRREWITPFICLFSCEFKHRFFYINQFEIMICYCWNFLSSLEDGFEILKFSAILMHFSFTLTAF